MLRMIVWTAAIWLVLVLFTGCAQQTPGAPATTGNDSKGKWTRPNSPKPEEVQKESPPQINAATYYTTGLLLESRGDYAGAVEKYNQTLQADPNHAAAANHLGICYIKLQKYDLAEKALQQAVRLSPNQAHIHNNLGFVYLLQNHLLSAEAELRNALAIDANNQRAHVNLAVALARQGKLDEALTHFQRAGTESEAQYNLAMILHSQGRFDLAQKHYGLALQSNPKFEPATVGLEQLKRDQAPQLVKVTQPAK